MNKFYLILCFWLLVSGCGLFEQEFSSAYGADRQQPVEAMILDELDRIPPGADAPPRTKIRTNRSSNRSRPSARMRNPNMSDSREPRRSQSFTPAGKVQIDNCRKSILQDDPELLRKAMGRNFNVNQRDIKGETLLQYAVRERKIRSVEFLMSRNAEVNCQDRFGLSPLFLCSRDRDADFADILIRAGAKTSLQEKVSGWNVFHKAAAENTGLRTLSVLMQEKSGLNQRDNQGKTPLHIAVSRTPHADVAIVEYLLKNGAEVNALDNNGCSPMDLTRQRDIVNCLRRYFGRRFKYTNLRDKRTRSTRVYY